MMHKIKTVAVRFLMTVFHTVFPIDNKKIIITSYYGKGYGDSGKYVCEELQKRALDLKVLWAVKGDYSKTLPSYVKAVKYGSFRMLYEMATAKIWVDNSRKFLGMKKRKGQYYLQMWHSNLRMKVIEKDAREHLPAEYIECAKHDSAMADAIIAGSDFGYNTIRNAFWYDGPIYKTGIPRCDELFNINPKTIELTKEKLSIPKDYKVFLYAPTFRTEGDIDLSGINTLEKELCKKCDDKYVLLVRFHPISKQRIDDTKFIKDATDYPNMQELINAADILITDYSGSMFDAAISHKPCILYTPDLENYLKKERELYFSFDELPFDNTSNLEDLAKAIADFNKKSYDKKVDAFLKKIGNYEKGESAKNVADLIESWLEK
ncbi:CDP-glycerol glycerophosphotransferase family protein [Candidatus Saccharibacteria bacterium]|nr:CDP-glycerol glycerophosphotransferase family protein [Candidatus Saccharibacteria bacterium]